ncbi:MAG: DUF4239 domain-containing protein [Candidatus Aenigmatarchaeota archaeon]
MKSYYYLIVIVLVSFTISLNRLDTFTLNEMSLFLTVIGLIYGLIAAFSINNSWDRFSKIRDAVSKEISSLLLLFKYSNYISDKKSRLALKKTLLEYCNEVPRVEWHDYWKSEDTHRKFRKIQDIVIGMKLKGEKDSVIFDQMTDELTNATNARDQQLILAQTKISKIQWVLNIFLSAVLVIGLLLLDISNFILSMFISTSMIAAVLMILVVIYEMNSMKVSEEEISIDPYIMMIKTIDPSSKITSKDILGK